MKQWTNSVKRIVIGLVFVGLLIMIVIGWYIQRDVEEPEINYTLTEEENKAEEPMQDVIELVQDEATQNFSANHNRYAYYEVHSLDPKNRRLFVSFYGRGTGEIEKYCADICDLAENYTEITENRICFEIGETSYQFDLTPYRASKDWTQLYNDLYLYVEQVSLKEAEKSSVQKSGQDAELEQDESLSVSQEYLDLYLTYEEDCSYRMTDGSEYRMVPVDRAAGSSFYVLLHTWSDGSEGIIVNNDPYLGSGGYAKYLTFLSDEQIGFSTLSYSGGAKGCFYRTADGGKSFQKVEYPSARVKLPNGMYYNPFIMPEKVWEEDEFLYMEAGQGADGDYYNEEGFCHGLYRSADQGITWEFVKEIAE